MIEQIILGVVVLTFAMAVYVVFFREKKRSGLTRINLNGSLHYGYIIEHLGPVEYKVRILGGKRLSVSLVDIELYNLGDPRFNKPVVGFDK